MVALSPKEYCMWLSTTPKSTQHDADMGNGWSGWCRGFSSLSTSRTSNHTEHWCFQSISWLRGVPPRILLLGFPPTVSWHTPSRTGCLIPYSTYQRHNTLLTNIPSVCPTIHGTLVKSARFRTRSASKFKLWSNWMAISIKFKCGWRLVGLICKKKNLRFWLSRITICSFRWHFQRLP